MDDRVVLVPAFNAWGEPGRGARRDAELVERRQKILSRAHYVVRQHAVGTPAGYVTDTLHFLDVEREIDPLRREAAAFCQEAEEGGSGRRVTIEVYPLRGPTDLGEKRFVSALRATLQVLLVGLQEAVDSRKADPINAALGRLRRADVLCSSAEERHRVAEMVEAAQSARRELSEARVFGDQEPRKAVLVEVDRALARGIRDVEQWRTS